MSPSLVELEGMTILEAMSCGLPIIVSDSTNSASNYFIKNNGLVFKNKNYIDLYEKLEYMYLNYKQNVKNYAINSLEIAHYYSFSKSRKFFLYNVEKLLKF